MFRATVWWLWPPLLASWGSCVCLTLSGSRTPPPSLCDVLPVEENLLSPCSMIANRQSFRRLRLFRAFDVGVSLQRPLLARSSNWCHTKRWRWTAIERNARCVRIELETRSTQTLTPNAKEREICKYSRSHLNFSQALSPSLRSIIISIDEHL
ncbi:hypothetical protein EV421DRAFT_612495 [Armillaria borealis]|uniref:Secreted protein n=1 Tax=Armillaria borealis TaxID=47425 RepID=A0AA39JFN3_9AGAR|nr:hypothetical protein EV421DRAFT_612495 [Armillaria borealis]